MHDEKEKENEPINNERSIKERELINSLNKLLDYFSTMPLEIKNQYVIDLKLISSFLFNGEKTASASLKEFYAKINQILNRSDINSSNLSTS